MSALSVSYFGPYGGIFRQEIQDSMLYKCGELKLPHSANFTLINIMGNQVEIRDWQLKSLSSDTISINNAILVHNSFKYPLIIDP